MSDTKKTKWDRPGVPKPGEASALANILLVVRLEWARAWLLEGEARYSTAIAEWLNDGQLPCDKLSAAEKSVAIVNYCLSKTREQEE